MSATPQENQAAQVLRIQLAAMILGNYELTSDKQAMHNRAKMALAQVDELIRVARTQSLP